MSASMPNAVDIAGHGGGSITGLIWGLAFFPRVNSPSAKKVAMIGKVSVAMFFTIQIVVFYTATNPPVLG